MKGIPPKQVLPPKPKCTSKSTVQEAPPLVEPLEGGNVVDNPIIADFKTTADLNTSDFEYPVEYQNDVPGDNVEESE